MQTGYVHVYTGNGKGKTTAAVGAAVRAAGSGLRVGFFQFLKSGASGELAALAKLGVEVGSPEGQDKFLWQMTDEEKTACARRQTQLLEQAATLAPALDVLVLDEVVCAVAEGMVPWQGLLALVQTRPAGTELILTGRGASEELVALADYVTEMRFVRHPFEKGVPARRGIEF